MVRAKAILLAAEGRSNAEIAERPEVARRSVSEWRKRFFEQGLDGLEERPGPGHPGSFPPGAQARARIHESEGAKPGDDGQLV